MKRFIICLSAGLALSLGQYTFAQHSIHSHSVVGSPRIESLAHIDHYIELHNLSLAHPRHLVSAEDRHYIDALCEFVRLGKANSDIIERFVHQHNASIDVQRAGLLLGIAYHLEGKDADALAQLNSLEEQSLYAYEVDKANLLRAYLYLAGRGIKPEVEKASALLEQVSRGKHIWADQAYLYRANILAHKAKYYQALNLLEGRMWGDDFLPEVEYLGALIAYHTVTLPSAIQHLKQLISKYPEMAGRTRLLGYMANAYYREGDYAEAERLLLQAGEMLLPEEYYALGAVRYAQTKYREALIPLQKASEGQGPVVPLAQYALGNIYRAEGDRIKAQFALEQAAGHSDSPLMLKENALYQLIELGYSGGQDAFGTQIRRAERFLNDYPKSVYRSRVLELISGYISNSTDYNAALSLIKRLTEQGIDLRDAKQEVLLREAIRQGVGSASYLPLLAEAISIGQSKVKQEVNTYAIARVLRADNLIAVGRYAAAEVDARAALAAPLGSAYQSGYASYLLGYALYNQKKYREASDAFITYAEGAKESHLKSDARLRAGDCALQAGELERALRQYELADELSADGSDEAMYRIASIYNKQGKYTEQIRIVRSVVSRHPNSPYIAQLMYSQGRAELMQGKTDLARNTFAELLRLYPSSPIAPTAMLEQALLLSNAGKDNDAIQIYKKLIDTYPLSKEAESALSDLRAIYSERGELDEYASYVRSLGSKVGKQPDDEAHLTYISIESKAKRGEQGITKLLEDYLRDYPSGADRLKAERMLIKQYQVEGRSLDALAHLREARALAKAEDVIALTIEEGDLLHSLGKTSEANKSYRVAYDLAKGTKMYSLWSGIKFVRTSPITANSESLSITQELLRRQDLSSEQRNELTLYKGRLEEAAKSFKVAMATYATLEQYPDSPYGAEATVRRADIALRLKQTAEVQKSLNAFIVSGSSQSYWLARAFILLSDSYAQGGDRYMAKQYLESLKDNYTGTEADIQEMIHSRLTKYK